MPPKDPASNRKTVDDITEQQHFEELRELDILEESQKSLKTSLGESTDCPTTIELIRSWVSTCVDGHRCCREDHDSSSPEPPTRLILISSSRQTARLVTAKDNFGQSLAYHLNNSDSTALYASNIRSPPYVALSYRWSPIPDTSRLLLTEATKLALEDGVSLHILPHTIRDACSVVLKLGYEHLWVDRLCIYQDSEQDWHSEASRMANVYKHALLTISASAASGEDAGFFRTRKKDGISKHSRRKAKKKPPLKLEEPFSFGEGEELICTKERLGYLADRGWVFQERLLSRRIVHFAVDDVHWECGYLETNATATYTNKLALNRPVIRAGLFTTAQEGDFTGRSGWGRLVEQYSRLKLTFESDRLAALSAVAREMLKEMRRECLARGDPRQEGYKEEYHAGLWKSTFLADLCWKYTAGTSDRSRGSQRGVLLDYTAPSWSWASQPTREVRWCQIPPTSDTEHLAKVTRLDLLHVGGDTFGAVQDGFMAVSGRSVPITILRKGHDMYRTGTMHNEHIEVDVPGFDVRGKHNEALTFITCSSGAFEVGTLEEQLTTGGSVQCWCLPICRYRRVDPNKASSDPPQDMAWCLLLAPNGTMRYRQTGKQSLGSPSDINSGSFEFQRVGWIEFEIGRIGRWEMWLSEAPERYSIIR